MADENGKVCETCKGLAQELESAHQQRMASTAIIERLLARLHESFGLDFTRLGWAPADLPNIVTGLLSYTETETRLKTQILETELAALRTVVDDVKSAIAAARLPATGGTTEQVSPSIIFDSAPPVHSIETCEDGSECALARMQLSAVKLELAGLREAQKFAKRERDAALARSVRDRETLEQFRTESVQTRRLVRHLRYLLGVSRASTNEAVLFEVIELLSALNLKDETTAFEELAAFDDCVEVDGNEDANL